MTEKFSKEKVDEKGIRIQSQMELFRQVFNYLDKTKCGIVYPEYFGELLRISGFNPSQAEIGELQNKYKDQRGLTFDDFIQLISVLDCTGT